MILFEHIHIQYTTEVIRFKFEVITIVSKKRYKINEWQSGDFY